MVSHAKKAACKLVPAQGARARALLGEFVMDVTEPYTFIWFGAMDDTKPYKFIGLGDMDDTKPYKFIGFGASDVLSAGS